MFYRRQRPDGTLGKIYWTRLHGKRTSTGCADLRAAEAWRKAREREGADPTYLRAKSARLEDAIKDFRAELRRRARAVATVEKNVKKLGHYIAKWGADFPLASIDARLVSEYIDTRLQEQGIRKGQTVSRLTIRDELVALRQVLALARRHGLFHVHPDDVMPTVWETKHKPKKDWIKEKDLEKLLGRLSPRRAAHVLYFVCCAGRSSDSFRSLREDWHLAPKGKETVLVRGSKTDGSFRTNPITPFLIPWVRRMLKDAPGKTALFDTWTMMLRDIKLACDQAGVAHVTTNGLRRSFGMWHRIRGYSLDIISKLFGHTTAKLVRDVYADVEGEELRAAMVASRRKQAS